MYIIKNALLTGCVVAGCLFHTVEARESGFELTLGRAIELHEAGGIDAALQIYRSLHEDRPYDPQLAYETARSLRANDDLPGCIERASVSAAVVSAWQARALGLSARCIQESGASHLALESYATALVLFPGDARLHFDYALALEGEGKHAAADDQLSAALGLADQDPSLYLDYAAWLAARQDASGALLMNLRYIIAAPHSTQAIGAAEQIQSLLSENQAGGEQASGAVFGAAYESARKAATSTDTAHSEADHLNLVLQSFVLESVSTAGPLQRDSALWQAAIDPLLSLADHDVLDAYLYFVAALARTEGSPEWLSAHRQKFERLVEYLARSAQTS